MKTVGEAIEKINDIQRIINRIDESMFDNSEISKMFSDATELLEEYIVCIRSMPLQTEVMKF